MNNTIFTPITLWQDFDGTEPLDMTIIKEEIIDDILVRELYFSGHAMGTLRPRIYGVYACKTSLIKPPCLCLISDVGKTVDMRLVRYFASRGYATFMHDYSGEISGRKRFTIYPDNFDYANYARAGRHLGYADETARENCWYLWTGVARYAISAALAQPESGNKLGIIGIRMGGLSAWLLATLDSRITCAGSLFFAGWERYRDCFKHAPQNAMAMDDEMRKYLAGIAVETYASNVNIPFLYLSATNDDCTEMDRAYDTLSRVPETTPLLFAFSPRLYNLLGDSNSKNLELFLSIYLYEKNITLPEKPQLTASNRNGALVFTLEIGTGVLPEVVRIFYAYDEYVPAERDWIPLTLKEIEKGLYEGTVTILHKANTISAYPLVTYQNGITLSGNMVFKEFGALKIELPPNRQEHVLYNGMMGEDSFTCYAIDASESTAEILLTKPSVSIATGPFGISGITNNYGALATYKFNSVGYRGGQDNLFKLDVYSKVAQKLTIFFFENKGRKDEKIYRQDYSLVGGQLWQSIEIKLSDLKTQDGYILRSWEHISMTAFRTESASAVYNNMLWV